MTLYDTVVIGAGPGGMTAAMYAARSELKVLLLERGAPGGQMTNTAEIENYPGYETIMGPDLSMKMHEPLEGLGVENAYGIVQNVTVNADGIKQSIFGQFVCFKNLVYFIKFFLDETRQCSYAFG